MNCSVCGGAQREAGAFVLVLPSFTSKFGWFVLVKLIISTRNKHYFGKILFGSTEYDRDPCSQFLPDKLNCYFERFLLSTIYNDNNNNNNIVIMFYNSVIIIIHIIHIGISMKAFFF